VAHSIERQANWPTEGCCRSLKSAMAHLTKSSSARNPRPESTSAGGARFSTTEPRPPDCPTPNRYGTASVPVRESSRSVLWTIC
jgi:hypothetical protein